MDAGDQSLDSFMVGGAQATCDTLTLPADPRTELDRVAGRYRLCSTLGRGGMGTVYLAIDEREHTQVAVKIPNKRRADAHFTQRLAAEAVAMRFLSHPHIVEVRDMGIDEPTGVPFVVMALASRGSAADLVRRGRIAPGRVARWGVQILSALSVAHRRGIVHRDIKPANILIDAADDALLADFGVAQIPDQGPAKKSKVGTPSFMPPEQQNVQAVGPGADLYALGATMYLLAAGRSPAQLHAWAWTDERWERVPESLRAILYRATRGRPERRFSDAHQVATRLAPLVGEGQLSPFLVSWLGSGEEG